MGGRKPRDPFEKGPLAFEIGAGDEIGEHGAIVGWRATERDAQALRGLPEKQGVVGFGDEERRQPEMIARGIDRAVRQVAQDEGERATKLRRKARTPAPPARRQQIFEAGFRRNTAGFGDGGEIVEADVHRRKKQFHSSGAPVAIADAERFLDPAGLAGRRPMSGD